MGVRKRLSLGLAALFAVIGGMFATAPAAHATVSGTVTCFYGNNAEVGVWVSAGAQSGWATIWDNGNGGKYYSYGAISAGTWYQLHVGCGGTPSAWGTTFYTPWVTGGSYDWICTTGYNCYQS